MQRIASLAVFFAFIVSLAPANLSAAAARRHGRAARTTAAGQPDIRSRAAVLMDLDSGEVLYARNAYVRRPPASTTKIATAVVLLQSGIPLSRIITISPHAARATGSSMHLLRGDRYALGELLEGLLWRSGNDAARAIAEVVSGDEQHFAVRMNAVAWKAGAFNTHFLNPHGLTENNHYTTAFDLALIARYALRDPHFRDLVATRQGVLTDAGGHQRTVHNTNLLLESLPGANGVKTGTTSAAGHCLVSSASREGLNLIAVVLYSPDRWGESANLLRYGFSHFQTKVVVHPGRVLARTRVHWGGAQDVAVTVDRALPVTVRRDSPPLRIRRILPGELRAPIRKGQMVGTLIVEQAGHPIARGRLVAAASVERRHDRWIREFLRFWPLHLYGAPAK